MNGHIPFQKLSEYADNELSAQERADVDTHLSACELCARELAAVKKIIDAGCELRSCLVFKTDAFVAKTMDRVRKRRKFRLFHRYVMPVSAAAAILIVAGVGFIDAHIEKKQLRASHAVSDNATPVDSEDFVGSRMSVRDIHSVLKRNGAQITTSSDEYVDAEVLFADYQRIRSELGFAELPGFIGDGSLNLATAGDGESVVSQGTRDRNVVTIRIRRK
jgi:hypothetical protein